MCLVCSLEGMMASTVELISRYLYPLLDSWISSQSFELLSTSQAPRNPGQFTHNSSDIHQLLINGR